MRMRWLTFALFLALALAACSSLGATSPPTIRASGGTLGSGAGGRAIVIDTDMAPDDWMAILFLLARPEIDVRAITVTGTGEAHCGPGVTNARKLTALAGQTSIPVACGRDTPMAGTHAFPSEWRAPVDSLLGITLPENTGTTTAGTAVDLLTSTLSAATEPLTILTLGPLTNVGELLKGKPDAAPKIASIVVMGGAVDVGGNVYLPNGPAPVAEWNLYVDPTAASIVVGAGIPIILVALDATNTVPITPAFASTLAGDARTASARFVSDVLKARAEFVNDGSLSFWDPLAAAIVVDDGIVAFETRSIRVVTDEGEDSGRTIGSPGTQVRLALRPDKARFESLLLASLNEAGN